MVLNPSFEKCCKQNDTLICSHFESCDTVSNILNFWKSPSEEGTPDYYHVENNSYNKYANYIGKYKPHTGNGCIGIALFGDNNNFEHIEGKLTAPLIKGKTYVVSFWVMQAYQFSDYCTRNIGAIITKKGLYRTGKKKGTVDYLYNIFSSDTSSIPLPETSICDTNWVLVSGYYTAIGGEKYISIGITWDSQIMKKIPYNKYLDKYSTNLQKNKANEGRFANDVIANGFILNTYIGEYKNSEFKNSSKAAYYLIDDVSVTVVN